MNKFIAISLPVLWVFHCWFLDHEYAWVLRSLVGVHIGYACAYVWKDNGSRDELVKYLMIDRKE